MTHLEQISIMHIILIYKLMVKVQEIKVDQIGTKLPHKKNTKKNILQAVWLLLPPHLNLTISSLGAKAPPCQQNTTSNN